MTHSEAEQKRPGIGGRAVTLMARLLAGVAMVIIVFMMVATVADVLRRETTGRAIPGVIEMGEVLMVASVFLGLAFAETRGAHVHMNIVLRRLPERTAAVVTSVGLVLVLLVVGWMAIVTGERAWAAFQTQEYRFGLVQIPVWPARIALALGLAAYFFSLLPRLSDALRKIRSVP
ncbi:TRAP transporter small permease subunit [Nesterenkonia flava]|uniref:TRAP transporter small permease n=1 Tax=Nesterenkonia flava TaxID=469799 RepID=A0ABU1FU95_9MICC|nr:TRAP transporter small permease [Nesterenkonia flava]MDR5712250.1 TRAP transporter small permease [Nesterenkonia flava]